jgi:hypothetical protein
MVTRPTSKPIQNGLHKIDEHAGHMLERGLVAVRVTLFVSKPTTVAQSFNEVDVSDDGSQHVWIHEFVDPDREVTAFLSPSRFALGHFAASKCLARSCPSF